MMSSDTAILEQRLNALIHDFAVPGLQLAVLRQKEIVYTGGFGVKDGSLTALVLPDTVFEAASISKPVVAYAALQLCAEGRLGLDRPLTLFFGDRQPSDFQLEGITVRHVLSHTSGLANWLADGETPRTRFTPGSRFSYSGVGYRLMQRVIEAVTGQGLAEYLAANVLQPCSMNDSSFIWRSDFDHRCATGHDARGQPMKKLQPLEAHAASSLHSTAADLARFLIATMQADSFAEAMFEAHVAVGDSAAWQPDWPRADSQVFPNVFWGLGWGLELTRPERFFWQWGDNSSFKAFAMASLGTGDGFVALSNSANGDKLWSHLAQEFLPGQHPSLQWLERIEAEA